MKKGFVITNGIAVFFAVISIGWLIYDFIAYSMLRGKMLRLEPLTPLDEKLGIFIWLGVLVFLIFHMSSFVAIASQFRLFKNATALRVIALILAIISCVLILDDIACLSDIGKEYAEGFEVESEWRSLYSTSGFHGVFFITMAANLIEAFIRKRKMQTNQAAVKDEVIFIVVHCVGILSGGIGLLGTYGAYFEKKTHTILQHTFPFMFALTLIPYGLLAGYWLIMKLREKPADWYDEKQFSDISKAGLFTMFATIPFMALHYLLNYSSALGPIHILWFPFYLFFVIFIFSCISLYLYWKN